jgi:hypothetical protein
MEAAKELIEQRPVYPTFTHVIFECQQIAPHQAQVIIALGEIVTEELEEEIVGSLRFRLRQRSIL